MRPFLNPVVKTHPAIAIALLCILAVFEQSPGRAAELEWTNADSSYPNIWETSTGTNWWDGASDTVFTASSAVIFGSSNLATAQSGTITISSSNGVVIGPDVSGTNPGMIVTGNGNWEFVLSYTTTTTSGSTSTTGTSGAGIGITGSGAGVLMEGTGTLTFSMTTGYTGTTTVRAGTLRLNVADAIAQSSDVVLSSTATLDLGGHDQTLKTLNVGPGASIMFNSDAANYRKLTLGALTGTGAVFMLRANLGAGLSDQIILTGTSEGAHTLGFDQYGDTAESADTSILVVENRGGGNATFGGTTDTGNYVYTVEQGANGNWYLNNTELPGRAAAAVAAFAASAARDWHYELDALYKRMGELRQPPTGGTASVWLRAAAARTNVGAALTGYDFHQYSYGATLGVDKAFRSGDSTWFAGAFGAFNRVDRDFGSGGDGSTDGVGGGLYVTWMHATGWFADLIGRMDRNKNDINAITADGYLAAANYNNSIKGLSLEFGRRLLWNEEWWIEPSLQYAAADIGGVDYEAGYVYRDRTALPAHVQKSRASQARASLRFGETGGSNPGWHPYAKIGFAYASTSGGRVRVGSGDNVRELAADLDGWRWEVGFGAAYVISSRSQFYYDYEYARATHYRRPWSVNAGYRFAW